MSRRTWVKHEPNILSRTDMSARAGKGRTVLPTILLMFTLSRSISISKSLDKLKNQWCNCIPIHEMSQWETCTTTTSFQDRLILLDLEVVVLCAMCSVDGELSRYSQDTAILDAEWMREVGYVVQDYGVKEWCTRSFARERTFILVYSKRRTSENPMKFRRRNTHQTNGQNWWQCQIDQCLLSLYIDDPLYPLTSWVPYILHIDIVLTVPQPQANYKSATEPGCAFPVTSTQERHQSGV